MRQGLTAASVESARPAAGRQIELADDRQPGHTLRVSPAGKKTWSLRYRTVQGEQRRLTLGTYPAVSLSQARTLARKAIGQVAGGLDPARVKKAAKVKARLRKLSTVASLIETYFEDAARGRHKPNGRPKRKSTMNLESDCYRRLIKPAFGSVPLADLTRNDVQRFLDRVGETAPSTARQCRNVIRQAYNYGIRREVIDRNPAQLVNLPRPRKRDRILTDAEMRAIWSAASDPVAVEGLKLSPLMGLAICLSMVTLQRAGEVIGLHAGELDRERRIWTIPGERTKNHNTHVVPLSDLAIEIIDLAFGLSTDEITLANDHWKGCAFKSPGKEGSMTRQALTRAVKRLTNRLGIADARSHDFRRTGSTNITGEHIGLPRFIVSRVLNHTSDTGGAAAVTGVYDWNDYLPEKRKALEAWSGLLLVIVGARSRVPNVVQMAAASTRM